METKFCPECGEMNIKSAKFCMACRFQFPIFAEKPVETQPNTSYASDSYNDDCNEEYPEDLNKYKKYNVNSNFSNIFIEQMENMGLLETPASIKGVKMKDLQHGENRKSLNRRTPNKSSFKEILKEGYVPQPEKKEVQVSSKKNKRK
jgi:hypothetical protein